MDDETNLVGSVDPREINKRVTEEHQKLSGNAGEVLLTDEGDEDIHDLHNAVEAANTLSNEALVEAARNTTEPVKPTSPIDELLLDFNTAPEGNAKVDAARALIAFKKAKKKGWDKLGVDDKTVDAIMAAAQTEATPEPAKANPQPKVGTKEKKAKPAPAKKPEPTSLAKAATTKTASSGGTKAEQARKLYDAGDMQALRDFKKSAKKGWEVLGFSPSEIEKILK